MIPFFNQYIENNYDKITSIFKKRSEELDFIYLPIVQDDILSSTEEFTSLINYFLPYSNTNRTPINHKIEIKESTATHSRKLFTSFNYSGKNSARIIKVNNRNRWDRQFHFRIFAVGKIRLFRKIDGGLCFMHNNHTNNKNKNRFSYTRRDWSETGKRKKIRRRNILKTAS